MIDQQAEQAYPLPSPILFRPLFASYYDSVKIIENRSRMRSCANRAANVCPRTMKGPSCDLKTAAVCATHLEDICVMNWRVKGQSEEILGEEGMER